MTVCVVRSFSGYAGDNVYGVFDNLKTAKEVRDSLNDSDVEVVKMVMNAKIESYSDELDSIVED